MIRLNTVSRALARPGARTFLVLATLALSAFAGRVHAFCNPGEVDTCDVYGVPGTRICGLNGVYGPCNTDEPTPPPVPVRPQVIGRTADTLKLKWEDSTRRSDVLYRLQHEEGSTWVDLVTLAGSGAAFDHSGLPPDTRHCYRIEATNSLGTRQSSPTCAFTNDGTGRRLTRLQIELETGGLAGAGTGDHNVQVVLTELSSTGINLTWLDYGQDDFEPGDVFKYDLMLDEIGLFSDITRIKISNQSSDPWCLAGFTLLASGEVVFQESLRHLPGGCLWLGHDSRYQVSHEVDHTRLRDHPMWAAYREPDLIRPGGVHPMFTGTLKIAGTDTVEQVEGLLGHFIHGTEVKWGHLYDRYVQAEPALAPGRVAVDLDLEVIANNWPDPELDVDVNLHFQPMCSADGREALIKITTESLRARADLNWFVDFLATALSVLTTRCTDCVRETEEYIAAKVEQRFKHIDRSLRRAVPTGTRCVSTETIVHLNADVEMVFHVLAETPPPPPPPPPQAPDLYATFDSTSRAPSCGTTIGRSCMADWLMGRGAGHETFAPNTIGGSCAEDRASFQRPLERSVEYIRVSTTDGSPLEPGREVRIDAGITALEYWLDAVDFFYTTDADHPNWTLIGTAVPSWEGETLSMTYRLPEGPRQAVRVQIRRDGSSEPCSPARRSDRDDLIFAVRSRLSSS